MVATCSRIDPPALGHGQRPVAGEAQAGGHLDGPLAAHLGGGAARSAPRGRTTDREPPPARTVSVPVMRAWWTKPTKSASGKAARSPASVAPGAGVGPPAGGAARRAGGPARRGGARSVPGPVGRGRAGLVGPGGHPAVSVDAGGNPGTQSFHRFFCHSSSSSSTNSRHRVGVVGDDVAAPVRRRAWACRARRPRRPSCCETHPVAVLPVGERLAQVGAVLAEPRRPGRASESTSSDLGSSNMASWNGQKIPWSRAHSAASAAVSAWGWPATGKGLNWSFTRPGWLFTKASSLGRSCWQKGHSKSAYSRMVTGRLGVAERGAQAGDVDDGPLLLVEGGVVLGQGPEDLVRPRAPSRPAGPPCAAIRGACLHSLCSVRQPSRVCGQPQ